MATQAHTRRADAPGAGWQGQEVVDRPARVLIVRVQSLHYLPLIALIGSGDIVGERLGAGEVVVAARGGDNIALTGDLASEAGNGAGHCLGVKTLSALGGHQPLPAIKVPWRPEHLSAMAPPLARSILAPFLLRVCGACMYHMDWSPRAWSSWGYIWIRIGLTLVDFAEEGNSGEAPANRRGMRRGMYVCLDVTMVLTHWDIREWLGGRGRFLFCIVRRIRYELDYYVCDGRGSRDVEDGAHSTCEARR